MNDILRMAAHQQAAQPLGEESRRLCEYGSRTDDPCGIKAEFELVMAARCACGPFLACTEHKTFVLLAPERVWSCTTCHKVLGKVSRAVPL